MAILSGHGKIERASAYKCGVPSIERSLTGNPLDLAEVRIGAQGGDRRPGHRGIHKHLPDHVRETVWQGLVANVEGTQRVELCVGVAAAEGKVRVEGEVLDLRQMSATAREGGRGEGVPVRWTCVEESRGSLAGEELRQRMAFTLFQGSRSMADESRAALIAHRAARSGRC